MPSPEIVVAGHICLDIIPTFQDDIPDRLFAPGTLIEVGRSLMATGGAVSNVGLALHRLGVPTTLVGKIGDDLFGRAVMDVLRGHDDSLAQGMIVAAGDTTSYTIVLSPPGVDRMFLHAPGANSTFHPDEVDAGCLDGARLFHFGYPTLMEQTYADGGTALTELFAEVRRRGAAVSLDMAQVDPRSKAGRVDWQAFLEEVLPQVDVFGPSIGEIMHMIGRDRRTLENADSIIAVADHLLEMGPAVVALKMGSDGLFLRTTAERTRLRDVPGIELDDRWSGRTLHHACFKVEAVGTTGAGDCTLAGFLAGLLRGRSPERCVRDASAVGACSVEREDSTSGVPSWDDVQHRVRRGWAQRSVSLDLDELEWSEEQALWMDRSGRRS